MPVGGAAAATLTVPSTSRIAPISIVASVSCGITLLKHEPRTHIPWQNTILFFIFGILGSFDHWFDFILFAYSVRRLRTSPFFLIAGVPTELGEILEQESQ